MVKNILIFTSDDYLDPATRIRGFYLKNFLSSHGWTARCYPFLNSHYLKLPMLGKVSLISKDLLSKIIIVGHSGSKIIFIQREISRPKLTLVFVLVSKYLLRKRVVYDFDDGLFASFTL